MINPEALNAALAGVREAKAAEKLAGEARDAAWHNMERCKNELDAAKDNLTAAWKVLDELIQGEL